MVARDKRGDKTDRRGSVLSLLEIDDSKRDWTEEESDKYFSDLDVGCDGYPMWGSVGHQIHGGIGATYGLPEAVDGVRFLL